MKITLVIKVHWEKYRFVMKILDPTEDYFHIDNKRILLITIKQIITSVQIRYNMFYECANKLYDCWHGIRSLRSLVIICFITINKIRSLSIQKYFPLGPDVTITNRYFSQCISHRLALADVLFAGWTHCIYIRGTSVYMLCIKSCIYYVYSHVYTI